MTEKELKSMSKDELEVLCKDKGVKLDKKLKNTLKTFKAVKESKNEKHISDYANMLNKNK